jgi:hypothetical protein
MIKHDFIHVHGNQALVATVLVLYAYRTPTQQIVGTKNTGQWIILGINVAGK